MIRESHFQFNVAIAYGLHFEFMWFRNFLFRVFISILHYIYAYHRYSIHFKFFEYLFAQLDSQNVIVNGTHEE